MRSWLRSRWLDLIVSLLVAAIEGAMVAPWLHLLVDAVPAPAGMMLVGLITFWTTRALLHERWDIAAARALSFGLWLAQMTVWIELALPADSASPFALIDRVMAADGATLALLAVGAVAWWRGLALGSDPQPFTADFVRHVAQRGVIVIGLALLVAVAAGGAVADDVSRAAAVATPIVVVGSLIAAAAVQVRATRTRLRSTREQRVDLGWLGVAAGLAAGILLLATVLAGIAGRHVWSQALSPLMTLITWAGTILFWLLIAVAFLFFLVIAPIIWLIRSLAGSDTQEQPPTTLGRPGFDQFSRDAHATLPDAVRIALEVGGLVVLGLLIVWLILRTMRRYRRSVQEDALEEVRESIWSRDLAMGQFKRLLGDLRVRRAARPRRLGLDLDRVPRDVRDAYRRILVLAATNGHPRSSTETPSDYTGRLKAHWPELIVPLDDLTDRYLDARYGDQSSDQDAAHALRDWEMIRAWTDHNHLGGKST